MFLFAATDAVRMVEKHNTEHESWRLAVVDQQRPTLLHAESLVACPDAPSLPPLTYRLCDVTCAFRVQVPLRSSHVNECDQSAPGVALTVNNFVLTTLETALFQRDFLWLKLVELIGRENEEDPHLVSLLLQRVVWMSGRAFCVEYSFSAQANTPPQETTLSSWTDAIAKFRCRELDTGSCTVSLVKLLHERNLVKNETVNAVQGLIKNMTESGFTFPTVVHYRTFGFQCLPEGQPIHFQARRSLAANSSQFAHDFHAFYNDTCSSATNDPSKLELISFTQPWIQL